MKAILATVLLIVLMNVSSENEINDTVIIEVGDITRERRHLLHAYSSPVAWERNYWKLSGLGDTCLTSKGILGTCQTFKVCYPYFKGTDQLIKYSNLNLWDYWVVGNFDTCSFYSTDGRQTSGVCCTNPTQEVSATIPLNDENGDSDTDDQKSKPPFQAGIFGGQAWPPPLPTHPPDHTAPTHPQHLGGVEPLTVSTPATTWPTKQSNLVTTSKRPLIQRPEDFYNEVLTDSTTSSACGLKNGSPDQNRIVGGQNADPLEWPWIAVLFNGPKQFCGGSLIDDVHILSAAHCVAHFTQWDVARLTVRLGDYNIRINTEIKHIERKVKRVVRHKGFDSRTLYNDIAILTLNQKVQFTKGIRPICLPSAKSDIFSGKTGTVVGWGSIREMGPQPSILQEVTLPIWRNDECRQKYGPAAPGGIIDSMICAGQGSKDSCSGGKGPLVVNQNHKWIQAGIVSWGIGCGKGQYPGVYTRITSFLPWIEKNTRDV